MKNDRRDVPFSTGTAATHERYETALVQFQSYVGDPIATIDAAVAEAPDFVSGHLLRALVLMTIAEKTYAPEIAASLERAAQWRHLANDRELALMQATRQYLDRDWQGTRLRLDRVLVDHPRDALALQVGHALDFFCGDALNLRNRVSRVLPHWDASVPGYSYVLGMHAFGLEEMNQYAAAEETGRRALSLQPKDGWAVHAVTHVMEMQGRIDEGTAWLTAREQDWSPDNAFAFHNWWHLALFHMDGGRFDQALALYDRHIHPGPAQFSLALVDATALLWRLWLEGVDVGERFTEIAREWEARLDAEQGFYAFNDVHAMLAFVGTGREDAIAGLAAALGVAAASGDTNAMMTREVGLPLAHGIEAFGRAHYADAVDLIEPVRDIAHRFGGSHAQRDVITLTLIEAALRSGQHGRAAHYVAERTVHRPASAWGRRLAARAAVAADGLRAS
jgi:tetratricopeptide (TPR) repeat protein